MKARFLLMLLAPITMFAVGCSTSSHFRIPEKTKLHVTDRPVTPDASGKWETSPFFWDQAGGAAYFLYDENGKMIRRGKLKTKFRIASIFWPPFALIYWPMGLMKNSTYDLTVPGDGYLVVDEALPAPVAVPAPAATPAPTKTAPTGKKAAPKAAAPAAPAATAAPAAEPAKPMKK